ncbi:urea ABC transporter permease subunit UrtB [Actibacterium sp. MT2.3-13A]|uniref:urea ABC transporter permease subunit UrtB n=1 Tax=Actibacterium sp. MT2.3-13A TaxID=2828332 RepID=UPI001BA50588|nr:urea ABC transporter permease subunit UrtB [Actibacterium sp. MT2.3-13A]
MIFLTRFRLVLPVVLAAFLGVQAAQAAPRDDLLAPVCAGGFGDQMAALQSIARYGVEGGGGDAVWALRVVEAFDGRALRCGPEAAFIETGDGLHSAATLEPVAAERAGALSSPSVNLKLRAVSASAAGLLTLMTAPDPAARAAALGVVAKRREAVTADLLERIAAAEADPNLKQAVSELHASLLLNDPDPQNRIQAIRAIGQSASQRNLSLLTQAAAAEKDPQVAAEAKSVIAGIERTLAAGKLMSALYSGMSYASILFLAALGLAVIFGLMGVINLAQGELIMIGAYSTWLVQEGLRAAAPGLLDYYLILAIPVSFAASAAVGIAMEALIIRRLYTRPLMTLLATWAISLLLINTVRVVFGSQNLEFHQPGYVSGGVQVLGDFIMTLNRLFAIGIAVVAFVAVLWLLRRTMFGLNIRAVTQNREMAGAAGIDTRRIDWMTFGLGSGLAGLAGLALSPLYNVNPNMGANFIVDSFMVVVLGGVGSLLGAVLAALGIGQINVVIEPVYGAVAAKVLVLLLIIGFIQWRPEGLFAPKGRR